MTERSPSTHSERHRDDCQAVLYPGRDCDCVPRPTWQCEFCGRFYSERTAKDHGYCVQAEDRRNAERAGAFDV